MDAAVPGVIQARAIRSRASDGRYVLTFAVVTCKKAGAIPESTRSILRERSPEQVPFDAESDLCWIDDTARTTFVGWQSGTDSLGMGSHWEARPTGVTAFAGRPWRTARTWERDRTWASQLADLLERCSPTMCLEELQGLYSAVSLSTDGHGYVWSDPLGLGLLYRAESDDLVVISNRASIAARLVTPPGREPARDVEGVTWLAHSGFIVGDRTGFDGVRTLPQGSYLELRPGEPPRVQRWATHPWLPADSSAAPDLPDVVRALREHLTASLRSLVGLSTWRTMAELTGGKDSRLVLALLIHGGMEREVVFNTWGSAELPDCIVASQLAERYGLEHRSAASSSPRTAVSDQLRAADPIGFLQRLQDHVRHTDGMMSTWDLRGAHQTPSPTLSLTGQCGEGLYSNYPGTGRLRTMAELDAVVHRSGFGSHGAGMLRPDAQAHYDEQIRAQLRSAMPQEGTPQDAVDGFYLATRLRRWFGTGQEADPRNRVSPLYSLPALRAAFALGSRRRRSEELVLELMRATCEELATLPFAATSWPAEALADLPDPARFRVPPVQPPGRRSSTMARTVGQENQARALDERIPVLRSQLDIGADHPLFDLIDRDAVLRAVDDFADLEPGARRGVHGAVTAAMWLTGAEQPG
jgi:hypothetical protein